MCQFKHEQESHEANMDKLKDMEAMDVMDDHDESSPEFIEARKIYCATYCDEKWDLHIHDKKTYKAFRGIDIFKYEDVFRCKICQYASSDSEDHMEHFDKEHANVDVLISVVLKNCN